MRIEKANSKAVNYACKNFHYSKTVPSVSHSYNIYNDNNEWCGVIVYGVGANPRIAQQFNKKNGEVIELERVALNGKQEITSKALSLSLRQLHKDNPLIKIVVSYADERQNHIGTIYQTTNWLYMGETEISGKEYKVNGKWVHARSIGHFSKSKIKKIKETCEHRKVSNKYKYLYIFDKEDRKLYESNKKKYPKKIDTQHNDSI